LVRPVECMISNRLAVDFYRMNVVASYKQNGKRKRKINASMLCEVPC